MFKHWSASSLWFLSPRLWDAERDGPDHPPTLMKIAHDSWLISLTGGPFESSIPPLRLPGLG